MDKTIISEGKTTNEAIENGLKILNVSKNKVDIKVLDKEDKRSFFNILAPRVVKVELKLKDNISLSSENTEIPIKREEIKLSKEEQQKAYKNIKDFLDKFISSLPENIEYEIEKQESKINVNLKSDDLGYLIGYRGETLYSLQNIVSTIAGKGIENRVRVILDIQGYKKRREKTLEELAEKVAKTVMKTKKQIKLEPMQAYERKIIHSILQENNEVETLSIGEEPNRRIVISLRK